jgi:transposase
VIAVSAGTRVLVATKPVDFRRGADGLVALVRETLGHAPFYRASFVFRSKRSDRVKIVAWDGSGLVLFRNSLASLVPTLIADMAARL